jgi:hypothetical protein
MKPNCLLRHWFRQWPWLHLLIAEYFDGNMGGSPYAFLDERNPDGPFDTVSSCFQALTIVKLADVARTGAELIAACDMAFGAIGQTGASTDPARMALCRCRNGVIGETGWGTYAVGSWRMIELRQLRYLIAAAEAGSFSRAARGRLGITLFDRQTRGATLTRKGSIYFRTASRS